MKPLEIFGIKNTALIVSLPANDMKLAEAAWDNGADVVKVHMNVEHRASGTRFGSFDEEKTFFNKLIETKRGTVGIVAGGNIESVVRDYTKAVELGFDFISLYAHHMPARFLNDARIKHMLAADYTYSLDKIKFLAKTSADIFEMSVIEPEGYGKPLNADDISRYGLICNSICKPVVLPTQRNILPEEIGMLKETGISGIMIGAIVTGKDENSLAKSVLNFRNAIDRSNDRTIK